MSEVKDETVERFKDDLARFTGRYEQYMVIVKATNGQIYWKSSDKTWALGAIRRFEWSTDEWDREDERQHMREAE